MQGARAMRTKHHCSISIGDDYVLRDIARSCTSFMHARARTSLVDCRCLRQRAHNSRWRSPSVVPQWLDYGVERLSFHPFSIFRHSSLFLKLLLCAGWFRHFVNFHRERRVICSKWKFISKIKPRNAHAGITLHAAENDDIFTVRL